MNPTPERYLSWREVQPLFGGISRTTAWRGVRAGWLPGPVRVSPGRRAWRSSDICDWQERLEEARAARGGVGGFARIRVRGRPLSASPPPDG